MPLILVFKGKGYLFLANKLGAAKIVKKLFK
jgi:hypothetical protein